MNLVGVDIREEDVPYEVHFATAPSLILSSGRRGQQLIVP